MSWNEEEMIREIPVVNLNLDEAVQILIQLRAFDILLCREILNTTPEDEDIKARIISDVGMMKVNEERYSIIEKQIEDIIEESSYFNILQLYTHQANMYVSIVHELYEQAKEQENE